MKNKSDKLDNNKNGEYQALLDKADELYVQGEFEKALDLLERIPPDSQEYSPSLFMKSMIIGIRGDRERSFEVFKKFFAEEFGPGGVDMDEKYRPVDMNDSEELFQYGWVLFNIFEDYGQAIEYFDKSLELNSNHADALHFKALSLLFLGESEKALGAIDEAIEIDSGNVRYWHDKGAILSELNQVSNAHDAFDKAIEIKDNPHSWSSKGTLCCQEDRLEEALECFAKAISLDRNDVYSIVCMASVYSELGEYEKANRYFRIAEGIDGNDITFLAEKGKHLLNRQEFKRSIDYFNRYLEIDDGFAIIWMYKSMALSELGRDEESNECFKKAIELDPDSISVFDEVFVIEE